MALVTRKQIIEDVKNFYDSPQIYFTTEEFPLKEQIPSEWINLINEFNDTGKASWLVEWNMVAERLPNVLNFVKNYVFAYALLLNKDNIPNLLYIYSNNDGQELYYYRGAVPTEDDRKTSKDETLNKFPPLLNSIYKYIHNGWHFYPGDSLGFLPLEDCQYLSEKDWDLDEETIKNYPFNLENVVTILHNGAGDYLCLDLSKVSDSNDVEGIIWWHEKPEQPSMGNNFWVTFDAWFGIGVEGIDSKNISRLID